MSKIEPGARVMVVRVAKDEHPQNLGRFGVVTERTAPPHEGEWWVKPLGTFVGRNVVGSLIEDAGETSFRTSSLKRLEDPGDDAVDELLAPLPQQDKVPV
jgi:hypothetical protein